jgi:hypothetical protein
MNIIQQKEVELIEMLYSLSKSIKCTFENQISLSLTNINYENSTYEIRLVASSDYLISNNKLYEIKDFLISEISIRKTKIKIDENVKLNIKIIDRNRTQNIEVKFKI